MGKTLIQVHLEPNFSPKTSSTERNFTSAYRVTRTKTGFKTLSSRPYSVRNTVNCTDQNSKLKGGHHGHSRVQNLIVLRRNGCCERVYKAVRFFETCSKQKRLVPNYENKMWWRTGKKNLFLRFRKVVEIISEFDPLTLDIRNQGADEAWKNALDGFSEHFYTVSNTRSLSSVMKEAPK